MGPAGRRTAAIGTHIGVVESPSGVLGCDQARHGPRHGPESDMQWPSGVPIVLFTLAEAPQGGCRTSTGGGLATYSAYQVP